MIETQNHEIDEAQLEATEQLVINRLQEIGSKLNQNYRPENMGMILAAEGVESRFSLGSAIVEAVWTGKLSLEQLESISTKLQSKKRLLDASVEDLEKDVLALGRLLSRIQIDFKGIFANDPRQKNMLLNSILQSIEVILAEHEKAKAGEVRAIGVRDYFEGSITTAIKNVSRLDEIYQNLDKNAIQVAVDRYQALLEVVKKIDPKLELERSTILKLKDSFHSIITFDFGDELTIETASEAEFNNVLLEFQKISEKVA